MATTNRTAPRKRRRRRAAVIIRPLIYIAIVFCLILGVSVFFRVAEVRVTGNTYYTDEQVIEASGIQQGSNLVFISKTAAKLKITGRLSYVDDVTITRRAPATVVIGISESSPLAAVESGGDWYIMGKNCELLDKTDAAGAQSLITVTGLTPIRPSVGDKLITSSDEASKVEYLSDLLGIFTRLEMSDQVGSIDMSSVSNASFTYMDRFTVRLGKYKKLEYKLELLESVISQKNSGERGTIDLSTEGVARFIAES